MRDRARRRIVAEAQSHRATPEELREASKRLKEIEQELSEMPLSAETKHGEAREERYARVLRLRALREDFTSEHEPIRGDHPNGLLLSLVMTVASFLVCAFCAGSIYAGARLINQKPNPADTAAAFWSAIESQNYAQIYSTYLSPAQRVAFRPDEFVKQATQADDFFGQVTGFRQDGPALVTGDRAVINYTVTRGGKKSYKCQLTLVLRGGSWGVDDLDSAIDPTQGHGGLVAPTATPEATDTPTSTPTS